MKAMRKSVGSSVVAALLLSGCATELVGQCGMKSITGDPLYAAGCGAAMAVTAVAVGAGVVMVVADKVKQATKGDAPAEGPQPTIEKVGNE